MQTEKEKSGNRLVAWFFMIFILFIGFSAAAQVVVKVRPNRPKIKVVKPKQPDKNHIWVDGHWVWNPRSKNYVWKRGYWEPVRTGHRYVAGHWEKAPGGWKWIPGAWVTTKTIKVGNAPGSPKKTVVIKKTPGADVQVHVVKKRPNRPKIKTKQPAAPGLDHIWVSGQWRWNPRSGNYVWDRGQWIVKRPGFRYVPGKWKKVPGGFYWVQGDWEKK